MSKKKKAFQIFDLWRKVLLDGYFHLIFLLNLWRMIPINVKCRDSNYFTEKFLKKCASSQRNFRDYFEINIILNNRINMKIFGISASMKKFHIYIFFKPPRESFTLSLLFEGSFKNFIIQNLFYLLQLWSNWIFLSTLH
jgi:hypothetical protein